MNESVLSGKKIGFVGAGNMAEALLKGLTLSKAVKPNQIVISDIVKTRLDLLKKTYGVEPVQNNLQLLARSDIIVLAIKPQTWESVLKEIGNALGSSKLLISVVAGVSVKSILRNVKKGTRVIRTIPNVAASVLASITAIALDNTTPADLKIAEAIFGTVGKTVGIEEKLVDTATGLGGSGPAYVFVIIEALADGAIKLGMTPSVALTFAAQAVFGAAKLVLESGEHPGKLKYMVTSPGGTAIAGLHMIETGGLRNALINAVEAATKRSEELGKTSSK